MRKISLALLIFMFSCVLVWFVSWHNQLAQNSLNQFARSISSTKVSIKTQTATTRFPLIFEYAKGIISIPVGFVSIPITLDKVAITTHVIPLILSRPEFDTKINIYDGEMTGTFKNEHRTAPVLSIKARDINLSKHPILQNFGVRGILNFKVDSTLDTDSNSVGLPKNSTISLSISSGSLLDPMGILARYNMPKISDFDLFVDVKQSRNDLNFDISLKTSELGHASISGNLRCIVAQLDYAKWDYYGNGVGEIAFTELGLSEFSKLINQIRQNMKFTWSRQLNKAVTIQL